MYIQCIGTEFGTLQKRRHTRSVEIPDVEITSDDCIQLLFSYSVYGHINYALQLLFIRNMRTG